ncbi:MAG: hypothetical protein V3S38_06785, partial [Acidimicrobiia bacterium]
FMFESLVLKGELLAMCVVSKDQLCKLGAKFNRVLGDSSEEGVVLVASEDGKWGFRVCAQTGIPQGVFDYPLTSATAVLLDRVDRWLRNGCKSGPTSTTFVP